MKISTLSSIVSIAGIIFFAIGLAIILLGKKVGAEGNGQQRIQIGDYIDINTNSLLTLILITACFAMAPIALTYWKPDLTSYVARDNLAQNYLAVKDLSLIIYGAFVIDNGRFADREFHLWY